MHLPLFKSARIALEDETILPNFLSFFIIFTIRDGAGIAAAALILAVIDLFVHAPHNLRLPRKKFSVISFCCYNIDFCICTNNPVHSEDMHCYFYPSAQNRVQQDLKHARSLLGVLTGFSPWYVRKNHAVDEQNIKITGLKYGALLRQIQVSIFQGERNLHNTCSRVVERMTMLSLMQRECTFRGLDSLFLV